MANVLTFKSDLDIVTGTPADIPQPARSRMTAAPDVNAAPAASSAPFDGVRVLEVSVSRPGRIAGMLLADLGADVVRAVTPQTPLRGSGDAEEPAWDRGKRVVRL